jgi:hypothetical protein
MARDPIESLAVIEVKMIKEEKSKIVLDKHQLRKLYNERRREKRKLNRDDINRLRREKYHNGGLKEKIKMVRDTKIPN